MNSHFFHFTLGPVQAFVAQARRTRDFWAGSFLLSWLSSVAIKAVQVQGGEIQFPCPDPHYMNWLEGKGQGTSPQQGSIPNRFKAMSARVSGDFDPTLVTGSVQQAWLAIAELIWQHDFAPLEFALEEERLRDVRAIWNRQLNGFWEMNWALTDTVDLTQLLERRKNWRTHLPPDEPGVKCMLMDGWQELSGLSSPNRTGLDLFWDAIRKGPGYAIETDLREGEYLCALAYIKRRFARYFEKLHHPMPRDWTLSGWSFSNSVPSLAHVASSRWLKKCFQLVEQNGHQDLLDTFSLAIEEAAPDVANERNALMPEIRKMMSQTSIDPSIAELDGSLWFDFLLNQENDNVRLRKLPALNRAQKALADLQKQKGIGKPHPYYAILLMDGDSLGSQMGDPAKQNGISIALNRFTQEAPAIVQKHNGFLIYAGGDDVLALLGVTDAMPCAQELRQCYDRCFAEQQKPGAEIFTTLSGAINIGHIKSPLRSLLFDTHHLLDDVAKNQTGRDALAVKVWKRDKPHLCWSIPWSVLLDGETNRFTQLLSEFSDGIISDSFIFKLRHLIDALGLNNDHELDTSALRMLIRAEYLQSMSSTNVARSLSNSWFDTLIDLCCQHHRILNGQKATIQSSNQLHMDGALLLRFMEDAGITAGTLSSNNTGATTC
jgi:CRISPR-associated protein, Crm2 family